MILKSYDSIQQKNFNILIKNHQLNHHPDGVIFNYSKISLPDAEKSALVKGLWFSLPSKKPMLIIMLIIFGKFELFYRSIQNLNDCNRTRTHNHLVCQQTLNHLVKLAK